MGVCKDTCKMVDGSDHLSHISIVEGWTHVTHSVSLSPDNVRPMHVDLNQSQLKPVDADLVF